MRGWGRDGDRQKGREGEGAKLSRDRGENLGVIVTHYDL